MNLANLSQKLNSSYCLRNKSRGYSRSLPTLIFMTDTFRVPDPLSVIQNLPRGAGVIFRHYEDPNHLKLLHILRQECRRKGLIFLIAGDLKLAQRFADGVHFPEGMAKKLPGEIIRPYKKFMITTAAHNKRALAQAVKINVDAILLSPVFPTKSHEGAKSLGLTRFAIECEAVKRPIYALGGISQLSGRKLRQTNCAGIAGISGFIR